MLQTKKCQKCGKDFTTYRDGKYCSPECFLGSKYGSGICIECGQPAQYRYCSPKCRNKYRCRVYNKGTRMFYFWREKLKVIKKLGGKCKQCGITDYRVLDINHIDRLKKNIPLKRNYSWEFRVKDWQKNIENLELLCSNCHRIHTWEQMDYGKYV